MHEELEILILKAAFRQDTQLFHTPILTSCKRNDTTSVPLNSPKRNLVQSMWLT